MANDENTSQNDKDIQTIGENTVEKIEAFLELKGRAQISNIELNTEAEEPTVTVFYITHSDRGENQEDVRIEDIYDPKKLEKLGVDKEVALKIRAEAAAAQTFEVREPTAGELLIDNLVMELDLESIDDITNIELNTEAEEPTITVSIHGSETPQDINMSAILYENTTDSADIKEMIRKDAAEKLITTFNETFAPTPSVENIPEFLRNGPDNDPQLTDEEREALAQASADNAESNSRFSFLKYLNFRKWKMFGGEGFDNAEQQERQEPVFSETITPDDNGAETWEDELEVSDEPEAAPANDHKTNPLGMTHETLIDAGSPEGVPGIKTIDKADKEAFHAGMHSGKHHVKDKVKVDNEAAADLHERIRQHNANLVTDFLKTKAPGVNTEEIQKIKYPRATMLITMEDGQQQIIDLSQTKKADAQSYIAGIEPFLISEGKLNADNKPKWLKSALNFAGMGTPTDIDVDTLEMLKSTLKKKGYRLKDVETAELTDEGDLRFNMTNDKTLSGQELNLDKKTVHIIINSAKDALAQNTAEFLHRTLPEGYDLSDIKSIHAPKRALLLKMEDPESVDRLVDISDMSGKDFGIFKRRVPDFLEYKDNLGPVPKTGILERIQNWFIDRRYANEQRNIVNRENGKDTAGRKEAIRRYKNKQSGNNTGATHTTTPSGAPSSFGNWIASKDEKKRMRKQLENADAIAAQNNSAATGQHDGGGDASPIVEESEPAPEANTQNTTSTETHDLDADTADTTAPEEEAPASETDEPVTSSAPEVTVDGDGDAPAEEVETQDAEAEIAAEASQPNGEEEAPEAVETEEPATTAKKQTTAKPETITPSDELADKLKKAAANDTPKPQPATNSNSNIVNMAFSNGTRLSVSTPRQNTVQANEQPDGTINIKIGPTFAQNAANTDPANTDTKPKTTEKTATKHTENYVASASEDDQISAKAIFEQEAPDLGLSKIKGVTADGVNGLVVELPNGTLKNLSVNLDETTFSDTRDLALAINLAKQNGNRQNAELFVSDLKMGPSIEQLENAYVNNKGRLVLDLKDGTHRNYGVKTKVKKSDNYESVEELADSVNRAIYNEKWRQVRENNATLDAAAA